jgi:acetylglutamate kinase
VLNINADTAAAAVAVALGAEKLVALTRSGSGFTETISPTCPRSTSWPSTTVPRRSALSREEVDAHGRFTGEVLNINADTAAAAVAVALGAEKLVGSESVSDEISELRSGQSEYRPSISVSATSFSAPSEVLNINADTAAAAVAVALGAEKLVALTDIEGLYSVGVDLRGDRGDHRDAPGLDQLAQRLGVHGDDLAHVPQPPRSPWRWARRSSWR